MSINLMSRLSRIFNRRSQGELLHISNSISNSLNTAKTDLSAIELQYIIYQAEGMWLDEWGSWFGKIRLPGETDESYRSRILAVTYNFKSTVPALIKVVRGYTGDDTLSVEIYQPYTNIFKVGESALSDADCIQDNDYYRSGILDVIVSHPLDTSLSSVVNATVAGGVRPHFTNLHQIVIAGTESDANLYYTHNIYVCVGMDYSPWFHIKPEVKYYVVEDDVNGIISFQGKMWRPVHEADRVAENSRNVYLSASISVEQSSATDYNYIGVSDNITILPTTNPSEHILHVDDVLSTGDSLWSQPVERSYRIPYSKDRFDLMIRF